MYRNRYLLVRIISVALMVYVPLFIGLVPAQAGNSDLTELGQEQVAEKSELAKMKEELNALKSTTSEAVEAFGKLDTSPLKKGLLEFHLFCQTAEHEVMPGKIVECLTYNGLLPGPIIRVKEGQLVRLIVHNQLNANTSLHMHGMVLPESVDGLPNSHAGLVKPKQTYAYQFVAKPVGTYWYHPQIMHADQKAKGLYGIFIVEPDDASIKTADQEIIIVLSDMVVDKSANVSGSPSKLVANTSVSSKSGSTIYLVNGKTAPAIPGIEVHANSRVRVRIINAGQHPVPLHLTGHKFEVVSLNGNLVGEQTARDTITCGVADRLDIQFIANNPGVWSLSSESIEQTTSNGQFPGGIVCLMRYVE